MNPPSYKNVTRREHILIVEAILGKPLPAGAQVHHVNEDRRDNRHTNLVVCPNQKYHALLHQRTRAYDACGHADWRKCVHCRQYDDTAKMRCYQTSWYHKHCAAAYQMRRRKKKRDAG